MLGLVPLVLGLALISALVVMVAEGPISFESLGTSLTWSLVTTLGRSPTGFVTTPIGWFVFWGLIIFGVTLVGTITAALVAVHRSAPAQGGPEHACIGLP